MSSPDRPSGRQSLGEEPPSFDTTAAHPARVYDYWLGGKDNYAADRDAGDLVRQALPSVVQGALANRAFLRRAVEFLAGEAGIRQFLDVGTGLPTADNTHEVAQRIAPASRIVYVDNDPIVLAHARALLDSAPEGATDYIEADLRDTGAILREAGRTLDLSQPVALMMLAVLHFIPDDDDPAELVGRLMDGLAPGSYLTISAGTDDIDTDRVTRAVGGFNHQRVAARVFLRSHADVSRFFTGLEMIEPGLVSVTDWRPPQAPEAPVPCYGGVARRLGRQGR